MANHLMNRRIGSRTDVQIPVTLRRQRQGFSWRGSRHVEAVIVNMSVTGVEVECTPLPGVTPHDRVIVEAENGAATAELRRIETLGTKRVHYGLLFLEIDAPFETAMNQIATGLGRDQIDWRWQTAR